MYNIGDEVYYITFFKKLKKCKILDKRFVRTHFSYGYFTTKTEFVVQFENGKIKIVNEEKIF